MRKKLIYTKLTRQTLKGKFWGDLRKQEEKIGDAGKREARPVVGGEKWDHRPLIGGILPRGTPP